MGNTEMASARIIDFLNTRRPDGPCLVVDLDVVRDNFKAFRHALPDSAIYYAVKANPSPDLLEVLWASGITHYDVASISEVRLVRETLPEAVLCYMHPVKPASAIAEAYKVHGVRTFSLDSREELDKIVKATAA